jgi:diguanylate cyclase (GGDEF)-like protein
VLEVIREGPEVVAIRLREQNFLVDSESQEVTIPKKFLVEFRLSEIPGDVVIKPVEAIEENLIHVENDIAIGCFTDGRALAHVEEMGRRKLWDGEVGFGKFMEAMRQAVGERHEVMGDVAESDFQDDEDYIFLRYEVLLSEDMAIENAIGHIEAVIARLEARRDQILRRRFDPLLEILDRGSFDADLPHTLELGQAKGFSAALVFVDIDHFKRVNDSHGHQAGDTVLKGIAQILSAATKGKGDAYRFGGEELVALLVNTTGQQAADVAEEIRRRVEESTFGAGISVTVSCGVASYPADGGTANELLAAADAALYQAKRAGRNVVRTA